VIIDVNPDNDDVIFNSSIYKMRENDFIISFEEISDFSKYTPKLIEEAKVSGNGTKQLWFKNTKLGDKEFKKVVDAIIDHNLFPNLQVVQLDNSDVSGASASSVNKLIALDKMKAFYLSSDTFSDDAAISIRDAVVGAKKLEVLMLKGDSLSDKTALAYARVARNPAARVDTLLIDGKNISPAAKNAVGYALDLKPKIKQIKENIAKKSMVNLKHINARGRR